jgi:hypothetical protein
MECRGNDFLSQLQNAEMDEQGTGRSYDEREIRQKFKIGMNIFCAPCIKNLMYRSTGVRARR